jgi:hypothetical protein
MLAWCWIFGDGLDVWGDVYLQTPQQISGSVSCDFDVIKLARPRK